MHKLIDILNKSREYLEKKNIDSARLNAELLISNVLNMKRLDLYLNYERPMQEDEIEIIREYIKRRGEGEPFQYIIGKEDFYGLTFNVNSNVLIPRADTEILVEKSLNLINSIEKPTVLDIGTGSGAIAVSIAKNRGDSYVLACDISEKALEIAASNGELNKVSNIKFVKSNLFENIKYKSFNLIVSNPPYIREEDYKDLMREVKKFEPKLALTAEENGLYFYRIITQESWKYLADEGYLVFETGYDQAEDVKELIEKTGKYYEIEITKDYNGINRVVSAKKCIN